MSERRSFEDAVEGALEWAVRKIVAGEGFSLVGIGLDGRGELNMLKITAEDDAQMISQAKQALAMTYSVAFCMVGTGQMRVPDGGPLDVLIVYTQDADDSHTTCRYASYEVYKKDGRPVFDMSDWIGETDVIEPWLERR